MIVDQYILNNLWLSALPINLQFPTTCQEWLLLAQSSQLQSQFTTKLNGRFQA